MSQFVPAAVYENLYSLFGYRGVKPSAPMAEAKEVVQKLNSHEFITISGERRNDLRGDCTFVAVLIAPDSKYSQKSADFKKLIANLLKLHSAGPLELLVVSEYGLTNHIKRYVAEFHEDNQRARIEDYDYGLFLIEVPKHVSVPEHTIPTDEEVQWFCDTFYKRPEEFPEIQHTDPVAVWLGLKPGMVVKVKRTSETAGYAIAYRYCI